MIRKLRNVLIVDDDDTSNFITSLCLKKHNKEINIEIKLNGLEATKYFNDTNCDEFSVVFLDINMPYMNGFEFLDWHKESVCSGKLKIVMLSTSNREEDKKTALSYKDVITYIQKPLDQKKIQFMLSKMNIDHG